MLLYLLYSYPLPALSSCSLLHLFFHRRRVFLFLASKSCTYLHTLILPRLPVDQYPHTVSILLLIVILRSPTAHLPTPLSLPSTLPSTPILPHPHPPRLPVHQYPQTVFILVYIVLLLSFNPSSPLLTAFLLLFLLLSPLPTLPVSQLSRPVQLAIGSPIPTEKRKQYAAPAAEAPPASSWPPEGLKTRPAVNRITRAPGS